MSATLIRPTVERFRTVRAGNVALAVLVAACVLLIFPQASAPRWSPRVVLYLVVLPWGVTALVRLARLRDRAAVAAGAVLLAACVAAAFAAAPFRSILPVYYRNGSVVIWAAALGVWAIARSRDSEGRTLLERVFVGATTFSIVVGVVQLIADVNSGALAMVADRASGLSQNPVYFGAFAVGAFAWWVAQRLQGSDLGGRLVSAGLAWSVLGLWISGSRIAFLAAVGTVLFAAWRSLRLTAVGIVPWVVVGVVAGELARWFNRSISSGSTAGTADRLSGSQVASGLTVRLDVWRFGWSAFGRRPIVGHGPGNHANAIQSHIDPEFASTVDIDDFAGVWPDAHNIVLELLVTVGVVGLIAVGAFVAVQFRLLNGPAAWAVAAMTATWLMQPMSVVSLLPVLAMLGVASRRAGDGGPTLSPMQPGLRNAVAVVGVLAAAWLIVTDALLVRVDDTRSIADGELVAAVWWHDPNTAHGGAVGGLREAVLSDDPEDAARILDLAREITERDPSLAFWWMRRGDLERIFELDADARRSYERAHELLPWSRSAILAVLDDENRPDERAELERRLAILDEASATD